MYSSATIAVGDKFDHFAHEVGLDRVRPGAVKNLRLDSSYDFDHNMHVVVADDLPDPTKQEADYLALLAPLLADVHLAMGGSTLNTASRTALRWTACTRWYSRSWPSTAWSWLPSLAAAT